jgi:hypothetical protein
VKVHLLLIACLSVVFSVSCGSAGNAHNDQQASGQANQFPSGAEFVYISAPTAAQVYGFHMDTNSGALTAVPGSPIAGPLGIKGRMFLSTDQHTLISVGEGGPSIKYSINGNDGSLSRVQSIDFSDNLNDSVVVAIDANAQFMYGIDQYRTTNAHLVGIRISDGSSIPGLGMNVQHVVSHPDQHTLYLDGKAFDIDSNTGALSPSTISDLPTNIGQLTRDGLTLVHQDEGFSETLAHIYHRSSITSPFSENPGSPIVTPGSETFGWYMEPSGTFVYLGNFDLQWYGYRLDNLQQVRPEPFNDFSVVDNTGKFGVQSNGVGTLRVEHYDSSTGIFGSTISTYSVPPFSNVRFIVGGN